MADGAAVDRAEVSRATRELMRLGLVSRQENGADRRSPTFALTAAGRKSFVRVRKPIGKFIEHMVDGLDANGSRSREQGALGHHQGMSHALARAVFAAGHSNRST